MRQIGQYFFVADGLRAVIVGQNLRGREAARGRMPAQVGADVVGSDFVGMFGFLKRRERLKLDRAHSGLRVFVPQALRGRDLTGDFADAGQHAFAGTAHGGIVQVDGFQVFRRPVAGDCGLRVEEGSFLHGFFRRLVQRAGGFFQRDDFQIRIYQLGGCVFGRFAVDKRLDIGVGNGGFARWQGGGGGMMFLMLFYRAFYSRFAENGLLGRFLCFRFGINYCMAAELVDEGTEGSCRFAEDVFFVFAFLVLIAGFFSILTRLLRRRFHRFGFFRFLSGFLPPSGGNDGFREVFFLILPRVRTLQHGQFVLP